VSKYNETEQKELELKYINQFLSLEKISLDCVSVPESDPPDVELHLESGVVYVELTELMCRSGEESRNRKVSLERLISSLKQKYSELHPKKCILATFRFQDEIDIRGKSKKAMNSSLLKTIESHMPDNNKSVVLDYADLPKGVESLEIFYSDKLTENLWSIAEVTFYGNIRLDELIKSSDVKNDRLIEVSWKERYDEAWLFLHTGREFASFIDLSIPPSYFKSEWEFTRIILFDSFGGRKGCPTYEIYKKSNLGYSM
jgi:hypothetical protein